MITWDAARCRELLADGKLYVPSIEDENAAGKVSEAIANLSDAGAIDVPHGYYLSVINDDDSDGQGLVISVSATGTDWPAASDGWSDIDNYLPRLGSDIERTPEEILDEMVGSVVGRAQRCLLFLQDVKRAFEVAGVQR